MKLQLISVAKQFAIHLSRGFYTWREAVSCANTVLSAPTAGATECKHPSAMFELETQGRTEDQPSRHDSPCSQQIDKDDDRDQRPDNRDGASDKVGKALPRCAEMSRDAASILSSAVRTSKFSRLADITHSSAEAGSGDVSGIS